MASTRHTPVQDLCGGWGGWEEPGPGIALTKASATVRLAAQRVCHLQAIPVAAGCDFGSQGAVWVTGPAGRGPQLSALGFDSRTL